MAADHVFFAAQTATGAAGVVAFAIDLWTVQIYGVWDSGAAQFEISVDGTNWESIEGATFTADGSVNIEAAPGCQLRANITVAGGSTSLTAVGNRKQKIGVM